MKPPAARDIAALVRLPAVLSVPGDVLLGAAMSGRRTGGRTLLLTGSSSLLYLAGMALNDWADREVDARERPERPIPSGRVAPGFALGLSAGLTAAGLALAAAAGRRTALAVAVPLAGAVWAYDLALKSTPAGPAAMASCRFLDVLVGAGAGAGRLRAALPAAGVVGAHTLVVSMVSRREVQGAGPGLGRRALAATAGVTAAAAALALSHLSRCRPAPGGDPPGRPGFGARQRVRRPRARLAAAGGLLGAYAGALGWAEFVAARVPTPANLQRVVGSGVLGLMPLEAALLAAAGPAPAAAAVAGAWPLAYRLSRRRPVT